MQKILVVAALVLGAATAACYGTYSGGSTAAGDDGGDAFGAEGGVVGSEGGVVSSSITWNHDIQPLMVTHCQGCHVAGGIAPMPLVTYQDGKTFGASIKDKTGSRAMPPWGAIATSTCKPRFGWKDDPSLTDAQIAMIASWVDGGMQEGAASDLKNTAPPAPVDLKSPTDKLKPAAPYSLSGSNDQYRCFVFDPKLTTTMYMNGSHVLPGNATTVHHVLMYAVAGGTAAITQPLDASGSYECFGGPGLAQTDLVAAWAPGGMPTEFPADVGIPLAAGTALVMQIHYHPHTDANPAPDATTFEMRLTPQKPTYFIAPKLIGNFPKGAVNGIGLLPDPDDRNGTPEFRIPANAKNHMETMVFTLPQALAAAQPRIYGVGAHMHLVGVNEQVTLKRAAPSAANPADECLVSVPAWDFNWQRRYDYATDISTLPLVSAGDVMTIACNYNNTMQNAAVANSLLAQGLKTPSDVVLGETTNDEMCLANVDFIYKAP